MNLSRRCLLVLTVLCATAATGLLPGRAASAAPARPVMSVAYAPDAGPQERLAAREVRRYLYLRTGLLPQLRQSDDLPDGDLVVVAVRGRPVLQKAAGDELLGRVRKLGEQEYVIRTVARDGRRVVVVAGGGPAGVLYGAYRLAEHLGVRFYLHGDVVPDARMKPRLPDIDDTGKPLFNLRGILPFHDFPEGPDWWSLDHYRSVISQLPKLRMNFIGFHTYPENGVGPEPGVWIGLPKDIGEGCRVEFSYPASWMNTLRGNWGYSAKETGDFVFGASQLFDRDAYGPDVMKGMCPEPTEPEQCNRLFRRAGLLWKGAFDWAEDLKVKTCVGTETPLTVPERVRGRILEGTDRKKLNQSDVLRLYKGMFRRIAQAYPLDYYWLWTPEGWTWQGASDEQVQTTVDDLHTAYDAIKAVDAPFTLATCGWVLGPPQNRALFDEELPKEMPVSCISRQVGHAPVETGFADVEGRPQWSIPWLEDDPALTSPQLWVGRMRKDAVDSLDYGCTGLMGIHWRTRCLGPNVLALAQAAWHQGDWDREAPPKEEGAVGGNHAGFSQPIEDTEEDPLYQTVRYDVSAYHLDVPNGTYRVTLKFCEPHYGEGGKRVFGVSLEGRRVIERLDIFEKVGKNRALDYRYDDVKVTDGWMDVKFHYITEFPSIAAIVVEGDEATKKVNCGGGSYGDYAADWPPNPDASPDRYLACDDFYRDWAATQFGPRAAEPVAELFTELDGHLPRPSTWVGGPGGLQPDGRPWAEVKDEYAFVEELAALRPRVEGAGNLARFDYWLNQLRYMRSVARVRCLWAEFNGAMKAVEAEEDAAARKKLARSRALPIRRELVAEVERVYRHLLAHVSNPGELGTVANWEQHILPPVLENPGRKLAEYLGEPLPLAATPSQEYDGPTRVIVPTKRTLIERGEDLDVKVMVLSEGDVERAVLRWRSMGGGGSFRTVALEHVNRGVYTAHVPEAATGGSFEYYVEAAAGGELARFPATAPDRAHTVVVWER